MKNKWRRRKNTGEPKRLFFLANVHVNLNLHMYISIWIANAKACKGVPFGDLFFGILKKGLQKKTIVLKMVFFNLLTFALFVLVGKHSITIQNHSTTIQNVIISSQLVFWIRSKSQLAPLYIINFCTGKSDKFGIFLKIKCSYCKCPTILADALRLL